MGCMSSKLFKNEFHQEALFSNGDYKNHVVSLTSSTLGLLKLDSEPMKELLEEKKFSPPPPSHVVISTKSEKIKVSVEKPEVINTWELMSDLEEDIPGSGSSRSTPAAAKKSPKFLQRVAEMGSGTPSKFFKQINSPKKYKKSVGKENKQRQNGFSSSPREVLKPFNSIENVQRGVVPTLKYPLKNTPLALKTDGFRFDSGFSSKSSRRSLSPLFDPELVASFQKELDEEGEHIKKMVTPPKPISRKSQESDSLLELFEKKCPPGVGENFVLIYTTTLRGIRKTFEDCNVVRSIIESHHVHLIERDISMDSGFREELRVLMGKKDVRVPLVFVKGRLIGGADEMVKLEEDCKLGVLFEGIPKASAACEGCAGVRFIMCMDCSGSCKVLDEEQKEMVKCEECNENGLIQCPICC